MLESEKAKIKKGDITDIEEEDDYNGMPDLIENYKEGVLDEEIRAVGGGKRVVEFTNVDFLMLLQNIPNIIFHVSPAKAKGEMYSPLIVGVPALVATWVLIPMIASRFGIVSAEYNLPIALVISAMMTYLSKDSTALRNLGGQLGERAGIKNIEATEKVVCAVIAAMCLFSNSVTSRNLQLLAGGAAIVGAVVGPETVIESGKLAAKTAIGAASTAAAVTTNVLKEASALVHTTQEAISILTRHSKVMRPAAIASGAIGLTAYGLSTAGITSIGTVPIVYPMLIVAASILLVASIYCAIYDHLQKSKRGTRDRALDRSKSDFSDLFTSPEALTVSAELIAEIQAGELRLENTMPVLEQKVELLSDMVAGKSPEEQKSLLDSMCKSASSIIDRITQLIPSRSRL